jgi:hypothetical protein
VFRDARYRLAFLAEVIWLLFGPTVGGDHGRIVGRMWAGGCPPAPERCSAVPTRENGACPGRATDGVLELSARCLHWERGERACKPGRATGQGQPAGAVREPGQAVGRCIALRNAPPTWPLGPERPRAGAGRAGAGSGSGWAIRARERGGGQVDVPETEVEGWFCVMGNGGRGAIRSCGG